MYSLSLIITLINLKEYVTIWLSHIIKDSNPKVLFPLLKTISPGLSPLKKIISGCGFMIYQSYYFEQYHFMSTIKSLTFLLTVKAK